MQPDFNAKFLHVLSRYVHVSIAYVIDIKV